MSVHTNRRSLLRLFLGILPAVGLSTIAGEYVIAAETEGHPLIVLPGEIRRYRGQKGRENNTTELLATSEETGRTLGLFRQTIAPAGGPPRHLHLREDEFAYVVSGQFEFLLADQLVAVPVGTSIFIPRKTVHTFKNIGTENGVLLFGITPAGFEMMFAEREGVDAETNKKLMQKHHMKVVGPPLS